MKKTSIVLILILFHFLNAIAVNDEQAILVTQNFLQEKNIEKENKLSQISIQEIVKNDDFAVFYIMNLGDNAGFVIVSASEYAPPIIGFSFSNEFQWQPAIQYYIDSYSDFIMHKKRDNITPDPMITKQWEHFLKKDFVPKSIVLNEIPPLITSRWNQDKFYNTYCPWDRNAPAGYDNRVPNGCVALATAQLMNYYRHPETGRHLTVSYKPNNYPTQMVTFSQHTYHWDAMCDKATNYTNEIAKLAYHLGIAVRMGYAPGGSGSQTSDAAIALREYFFYTDFQAWPGSDINIIKSELDQLQPLIMSGDNGTSGHAYLLDGYIETIIDDEPVSLFHFNWGWGGSSDGYFLLREHPFANNADVFIGIKPATNYPVQCSHLKRQTAFEGYVANGSTNQPYESNPDCSWIIAAPGAKNYKFSFSKLDTQEGVDEVTIYQGGTKSSGVAAKFSGTSIPDPVNVYADSVLVTFTSNNPAIANSKHLGFLLSYVADKPQQKCDVMKYLSEPSGVITDGASSNENYTPWVSCTWNLNPSNASGFFGLFHEFDLKLGDFIDIYDATKSTPLFWKRYDIYSMPTVGEVLSIPFSKVQIKFITDNFEEGNGFKFQYFTILGVDDNSLLNNINIFPNPANDVINLSFSSEWTNQSITCRLVDVMGKEVYSNTIDYHGDIYATQIPVANLAKGFYLLQLVTSNGISTSKVIVN